MNTSAEDGHRNGKFGIVPAEDELARKKVPRLRTTARHSKHLTDGAKVLFDELTDLSFLDSVSPQLGVVEMSKKVLARELHVCERTLTRWTRELEQTQFVWTRTIWKGGFELTLWFIRGLANPQMEIFDRPDPSWGSPKGQRRRIAVRNGKGRFSKPLTPARADGGQICPLDGSTVKSAVLTQKSPAYGQDCPLPGDSSVPGQGTAVSPAKGQPCPFPTDTDVREPGTAVSLGRGQPCPQTADSVVRQPGTPVSESKETPALKESGGLSFKRSTGLNAKRSISGNGKTASREKVFLLDVAAMMERWRKGSSKAELSGSGAWWRLAFRADPGLMERVLADTFSQVKEGGIKQSPGQHAVDLWKRWGGKLPEKEAA